MSFLWRAIYFVDSFFNFAILTGAFASIASVWIRPCSYGSKALQAIIKLRGVTTKYEL